MRLREKLWWARASQGLDWVIALPEHHFAETKATRVRSFSALLPGGESDGALLLWTFDSEPGKRHTLAVRLTEDEANRVYSADPYSVGILEPVRRHIADRWAVLMIKHGDNQHALPYRIPRRRSEKAFIANLDKAAERCKNYEPINSRKPTVSAAQDRANEIAKDFAFA